MNQRPETAPLTPAPSPTQSYQSLARKYRPKDFTEFVGQEPVAMALASAIRLGREPHGVVFSGVRGIGKTTTARLYAKALNCSQGPTAQPCGTCESCIAIATGTHLDVLEIDGASNTSVDDVRALRETIGYAPQLSKFKVYIIDEVHMLSTSAFNALLKTLEEPPAHVIFIFATTELRRIPATILSRCQVFHLQKMSCAVIAARLQQVLKQEQIPFEERALQVIAKEGHGSMRDALTLLDQAIALGEGAITEAALREIFATVSAAEYQRWLEALVKKDGHSALKSIQHIEEQGVPLGLAVEELATLARHCMILRDLGEKAIETQLLKLDDSERMQLSAIAALAAPFDLNRIFRTITKCRSELDGSVLDRFVIENYCLEWCLDPGFPSLADLGNQVLAQKTTQASQAATAAPQFGQIPQATVQKAVSTQAQAPVSALAAPANPPNVRTLGAPIFTAPVPSTPPRPQTPNPASRAGASAAALNPESTVQTSTPVAAFPPTWRDLVDLWKKAKPLQARKLEETLPVEYSPERITIAVPENSLAASSLLPREEQQKVREYFEQLFGFKGLLQIIPRSLAPNAGEEHAAVQIPNPTHQGASQRVETILETREREKQAERERVIQEVKTSEFTKDALSIFGGTIEGVKITDPSLM